MKGKTKKPKEKTQKKIHSDIQKILYELTEMDFELRSINIHDT